jgi:voltage-gated potassium channel
VTPVDLARNRRSLVVAVLRALLAATAIVALYFVLPLDRLGDRLPAVALALALVGFFGLMGYEVWSTLHSPHPAARGLQALGTLAPLFLVIFAATYHIMSLRSSGAFNEPELGRLDALYLTVATFTTVGFGDITATSEAARATVTVQMVLDLVVIGAGVRAILGAIRYGQRRQFGNQV